MAGVPKSDLITLDGFPRGLNNRAREESLPRGALRGAENIDIDNDGKISRRAGYTLEKSKPNAHSLWSHYDFPAMFMASNGSLEAYDAALQIIDSVPLIRGNDPISYAVAAGTAYWSNGTDRGTFTSAGVFADWGIEQPGGNPDLAPQTGVGGLYAGTYQVAVTFVHADGRESGASLATMVDVEEGDGLMLSNIPQPQSPSIETVRIYRTTQNGDVLFLAMDLPVGITSTLLGAQQVGRALETQFRQAMPAGQIVRYHNGRILVASGPYLYWSDTFNYGLTKLQENYVKFNADITLLEPVGHAGNVSLFVAAGDRTYSVLGADPKDWTRTVVAPYGAVPGASCHVDAKTLGLDTTGEVAVWMAKDGGLLAGLQTGLLVRLHDEHYVAATGIERGSLAVREINGISQLLATLQGGNKSGLAMGDSVEAEVWKDGRRIR